MKKRKVDGKINGKIYNDLLEEENSPRTGSWYL